MSKKTKSKWIPLVIGGVLVVAALLVVFLWRPWESGGREGQSVKIDEEHFPDAGFRKYVSLIKTETGH